MFSRKNGVKADATSSSSGNSSASLITRSSSDTSDLPSSTDTQSSFRDTPPQSRSASSIFQKLKKTSKNDKSQADDAGVDMPSTMSSILGVLDSSVTPIWELPYIQNAVSVLDQLSVLGNTMPFVAPAFTILKMIIDVERKARDADAKCSDLLERITFMLGHLTVLEKVSVGDTTKEVIERMNKVLKVSASLIEAYRKLGPVARRLHIGNKDKFAACASALGVCSDDLMMSLQIHQTSQLEILMRPVPVDAQDEAAQTFVTSHGGVDKILHDEALLAQFAQHMRLTLDDAAMEQINSNLNDMMQQTHVEIGRILNDNVGTAVVDGFKELAVLMAEATKEQVFTCVQCEKEYRNSINTPTSCSFHRAEYSSWNKNWPCCGSSHPCQVNAHRATHHYDYPYATFFAHARRITNYIDTVENWMSVQETNLEDNTTQKASIGRLLRWATKTERIKEPTILIIVGTVSHSYPYFFDTFSVVELEFAARSVSMTHDTTIFRSSTSGSDYAMAEWVVSPKGTIIGVRLTAQVATAESPSVQFCPIDAATCSKNGDVLRLSEGGFTYYTPDGPYVLPATVRAGPELSDKPARSPRTDFKTQTTSALPVVLKTMSDPPLQANPKFASTDRDNFVGTISVFNAHPAGSQAPITIAGVRALARLVGDKTYTRTQSFQFTDNARLPVTIDPRQSWSFSFEAAVSRSQEDAKLGLRWFDRAFVARNRPLRLKIVLEDIEGNECSLVLEYVYTSFPLEKAKPSDLCFLHFDDPQRWERNCVRVSKIDQGVRIGPRELTRKRLESISYEALKTGETEISLDVGEDKGSWRWDAWALVDLSCRRVYAFKIRLLMLPQDAIADVTGSLGCLGYVLCPDYGEPRKTTRPISYALEKVTFSAPQEYKAPVFSNDDDFDDVKPDVPKPSAPNQSIGAPSSANAMPVTSEALEQRLTSIDDKLSRIAGALERLVEILSRK